jgi:hypothetical protein
MFLSNYKIGICFTLIDTIKNQLLLSSPLMEVNKKTCLINRQKLYFHKAFSKMKIEINVCFMIKIKLKIFIARFCILIDFYATMLTQCFASIT